MEPGRLREERKELFKRQKKKKKKKRRKKKEEKTIIFHCIQPRRHSALKIAPYNNTTRADKRQRFGFSFSFLSLFFFFLLLWNELLFECVFFKPLYCKNKRKSKPGGSAAAASRTRRSADRGTAPRGAALVGARIVRGCGTTQAAVGAGEAPRGETRPRGCGTGEFWRAELRAAKRTPVRREREGGK